MDHDPLEGLMDQDENAIERSLELLRADLLESEQQPPVDTAMDLEVEYPSPNQGSHAREEDQPDENEEDILRIEGDIVDDVNPKPMSKPRVTTSYRVQVVVPEISWEERAQYSFVHSEIVESILGEVHDKKTVDYRVEFTDGRKELVGGYSFIHRAVLFAHGRLSRASIVILPNSHWFLLSCSVRFRCGGLNTAAIVYSLPYSLQSSQIYTPLFISPAPLLFISRPSPAHVAFSFDSLHTHLILATDH
jgi:hypothetical protein